MDPEAVKSTLSDLNMGHVIAAAARDYQKVISNSSLHKFIPSHINGKNLPYFLFSVAIFFD